MLFPEGGLVYDYSLDDGGASMKAGDDDEDDKKTKKTPVRIVFVPAPIS